MIKSIHGHNYQSHRDSNIELSPGVNFFIGPSDSGKSSILRMLKWLATNRPLGDGFVSWGSKGETAVEVLLDDDVSIMHKPGSYSLIKGKDRQDWSAIGTGVPETITQALNISELSWASQMDPPFLLSASPGEVARTLNEVADLDKIDSTLVNINRMARDNRSQLTETAIRKQQLEIELSQYRGLDGQLKMIASLKEMERKAGALEELVEVGTGLLSHVKEVSGKLPAYQSVDDWLLCVVKLVGITARATELETVIEKGEFVHTEIAHLRSRLERVKDTYDAEAELDLLLDMTGRLEKLEKDTMVIECQIINAGVTTTHLKQAIERLSKLEKQWKAEFPSACPLCGRSD
jgi:energy-coupling factor transporter ATP-binding protein EcfA2